MATAPNSFLFGPTAATTYSSPASAPQHYSPAANKSVLLFFAGSIPKAGGDPGYSGGVRQAMYEQYKDGHDRDVQVGGAGALQCG